MPLHSDVNIDASKLRPDAVSDASKQMNDYLTKIQEDEPKWFEVGAATYRKMIEKGETLLPVPTTLEHGYTFSIPSRDRGRQIPCRVFKPKGGKEPKAVFMHIHGGGWVLNSEASQDPLLDAISNADVTVISVGYRLAPENPFPAGPQDCFDAAEWLVNNAKSELHADLKFVGGESAGSHLAVLTIFHLSTARPQFKFVGAVLDYGVYDLSQFLPSVHIFDKTLMLDPENADHFVGAFCPGLTVEQRRDSSISPFYRNLAGLNLPSALFICGTEDPLLEDTLMMGLRWQMSGAEAIVKLYPGAPHGFNLFPRDKLENADKCLNDIHMYLIEGLSW